MVYEKGKYYINDREVEKNEFLSSVEEGHYVDLDGGYFHRAVRTVNAQKFGIPIEGDVDMIVLHREDGPAQVYAYGQQEWWQDGVLHRNPQEGPAIVFSNGKGDYWVEGRRLSERKQWWLNSWFKKWVLWLMKVGLISLFISIGAGCEYIYPKEIAWCTDLCKTNQGLKRMFKANNKFLCECNNDLRSDAIPGVP